MKKQLYVLFLVSLTTALVAQAPPDTLWTRTYGGSSSDIPYSVEQTTDGGFIISGESSSYGSNALDFWLVKTDENGNEVWNQTYGGSLHDSARSAKQTADGGYILAGETWSYGAGTFDFWLVKTDENGNEEWNQTYGGSEHDRAYSVQQTTDGGYIVAGWTCSYGAGNEDFWLVRTDENGNEEWNQTYGGGSYDKAFSVQRTLDEGFIVAGVTRSYGAGFADFWLVKTDEYGNEEWNQTYGGTYHEGAYSVQQTTDGGYIVAGYTESYGAGFDDIWLVKTDENGNEEWNQAYGGSEQDRAYSVQQTLDGGYIIAGMSSSYGAGEYDFWLVKTDENGNEEWNQNYGGTNSNGARSVQQTSDEGYIVTGYTYPSGASTTDCLLIRFASEVSSDGNTIPNSECLISKLSNYPNPFNPTTTISFSLQNNSNVELSVYNIKGQLVETLVIEFKPSGEHSIVWNAENQASGIYFYKLKAGEYSKTRKMLLLR